jgi:Mrp family chromosome partitioning ATPase
LTGASIAKIFGVKDHPIHTSTGIAPPASRAGVKLVSMNLLMDRDDAALVWRGPMINSAIRQLYSELEWGELDFLLVDLPPGCVSSDTRVYANGAPITVSQLKQGDHVYSVSSQILRDCKRNSLTAAVERRRVLEVVPQGESEVFEIRTKSRSLRATSNHPILAVNRRRLLGSRFYDYSLQWRRLGDLKPRDIIAVVKKLPESPRPMRRLPRVNVKTAKRIDMPGEVTDDFARLVGYFLGDGFVRIDPKTRTYQVLFAEPPEGRYRSHYIQLLRRIFGRIRVYQDSKHFGLLSRPAAELFRELDLFRHALEKRIPLWIFTLPISQKRAFIEGYCDADGCRRQGKPLFRREGWMNFESPNRLLMEDLRSLCITAGLRVTNLYSRVRTLRPPSGRTYTSKLWSFESSDQSRSSRYGAGLIRGEAGLGLVNDYVGFERVSRVARVGRQEVYDLKVDGNESFVADGIIVHNTSDAPLTVFQSLPLDAVLIVSSPQDLAVTIVAKAVNMAKIMNVPILGLIENMSYVTCPDCGRKIELFGSSKGQEASNAFSIEYLGSIPVNPLISQLCDEGKIEEYESPEFAGITQRLIEKTRQLNVPQTLRSTDKSMEKESGR